MMNNTISRQELEAMLNRAERVWLVEALPLHAYEQGHIPGALCLPPDQVQQQASHRLPDMQGQIVVYADSLDANNASQVAQQLQTLGYKNVRVYAEGKSDWIDSGHELQAGPPDMLQAGQARQSAEKAFHQQS